MSIKLDRTGETRKNANGDELKIVAYENCHKIVVENLRTGRRITTSYWKFAHDKCFTSNPATKSMYNLKDITGWLEANFPQLDSEDVANITPENDTKGAVEQSEETVEHEAKNNQQTQSEVKPLSSDSEVSEQPSAKCAYAALWGCFTIVAASILLALALLYW